MLRTLIIAPLVTLYNWKEEFGIHSYVPASSIHVLHGTATKKLNTIKKGCFIGGKSKNAIVILNYETMLNPSIYQMLVDWNIEAIVLDEVHYIKNAKAKRSKLITKLSVSIPYRYALTGTPILNSVKDVFNVMKFIDNGETFGTNEYVFQSKYMTDANAQWKGKGAKYFPKWEVNVDKYAELTAKLYKKCHRVLKKDVMKDLPPLVKVSRLVELSPDQARHYKEMKRDLVTFIADKTKAGTDKAAVARLAITKALRLQQICAGFVKTEEGDEIIIEKNPRLDLVKELLQEIVVDNKHQCILWCSFKANYGQLSKVCQKLKIPHTFITGEQSLIEKQESVKALQSGESRVIIANRRAGGIGINLVEASYSIVYSRNFSLGEELQSEARNHRGGSQIHERITKIDIAAKDTIDEHVLQSLKGKQELSDQIIDLL